MLSRGWGDRLYRLMHCTTLRESSQRYAAAKPRIKNFNQFNPFLIFCCILEINQYIFRPRLMYWRDQFTASSNWSFFYAPARRNVCPGEPLGEGDVGMHYGCPAMNRWVETGFLNGEKEQKNHDRNNWWISKMSDHLSLYQAFCYLPRRVGHRDDQYSRPSLKGLRNWPGCANRKTGLWRLEKVGLTEDESDEYRTQASRG